MFFLGPGKASVLPLTQREPNLYAADGCPRSADLQTNSGAQYVYARSIAETTFPSAFAEVNAQCAAYGLALWAVQASTGSNDYELRGPSYGDNECPAGVRPHTACIGPHA